jgi:hypothetical protein
MAVAKGRRKRVSTVLPTTGSGTSILKIYCRRCMTMKGAKTHFYIATNPIIDKNGYMSVCKDCCNEIYTEHYMVYKDIPKAIYETCRDLDIVYSIDALNMTLSHYTTMSIRNVGDESSLFGFYKSKASTFALSFGKVENTRFRESDDFMGKGTGSEEEAITLTSQEDDLRELQNFWGKNRTREELDFLDNEFARMQQSFECPDFGMELIMRDICFLNLKIERERENGDDAIKLIQERTKLMGEAKMKPIQAIDIEANETVSFGTMIKKWENEKPIPKQVDNELIKSMEYFIAQLARMEGIENPMTDQMLKELEEYSIDAESLKNTLEGEDIVDIGE